MICLYFNDFLLFQHTRIYMPSLVWTVSASVLKNDAQRENIHSLLPSGHPLIAVFIYCGVSVTSVIVDFPRGLQHPWSLSPRCHTGASLMQKNDLETAQTKPGTPRGSHEFGKVFFYNKDESGGSPSGRGEPLFLKSLRPTRVTG